MTDNLTNLETAVEGFLAQEPNPSPERIRELIEMFRIIPTCVVDDATAEYLARRFETRHGVTMTIGSVLTDHDKQYAPWLDAQRSTITPYYWDRYKKFLAKKDMSSQVLATMDSVTDRILGLLENPQKEVAWDRRGMVVGHVQSGKTANYTGLICKAADAGYRLIIVIAGIHNNLRNQTQIRIDEGFVGRDSARRVSEKERRIIGVGNFDSTKQPWTFTTSVRDFNKIGAEQVGGKLSDLSVPAVFVIKKNSSTLKNLLEWLQEHNAKSGVNTVDAPMLVIDDEADNASINIKHGSNEVSRINGQIRSLLKMFEHSCYVGYTATPFANIFISPDSDDEMRGQDLFPRNFIVSLDPPTNYFGANRVFLDEDSGSVLRTIDDNEDLLSIKHKKDMQIAGFPESLNEAIRTFVLARAIRLVRGHQHEHSSMLVNASRFTDVQSQIRNEIHNKLESIKSSARINGALPEAKALKDPEIAALHKTWQKEYAGSGASWKDIQAQLHESASPIKAVEVNSKSSGTLNYSDHEKTGLSVIAVGGFSLSRGLTLEGLMVSYFLRNSMMYDTLMQMGRWFGYRDDYDDLCRIWMPDEAQGWYRHIAESIEELREEMRVMAAAGATPEEFGLKVRSHPDTLIVTARNKMGSSEKVVVNIGLGNSFVETAVIRRDGDSQDANMQAVQLFAKESSAAGKPISIAEAVTGGWLLKDVPVKPVLDFLAAYRNHPGSMLTEPGPVRRYIENRAEGELKFWDVLFTSSSRQDHTPLIDETLGIKIVSQRRAAGSKSNDKTLYVTDNQRVSSRGVEKAGIDPTKADQAESAFRSGPDYKEGSTNYPDRIYRAVRDKPLLIIHLLSIGKPQEDLSGQKPTVAWSISFPKSQIEEDTVEYVVNTTWLRENFHDELDEDEMAGDNE